MYYTIVLIVFTVLLILGLLLVGYILSRGNNVNFPDYQYVCPDFWDVSGATCSPSVWGLNIPSPDKFMGTSPSIKHTGVTVNDKKVVSIDTTSSSWSGICDQASWAKTNGIYWDGVTNSNQC